MDHVVGGGASGRLPNFNPLPNANEPARPNGIYVPRFRNTPSSKTQSKFIRGYGYQGGAGPEFNFSAEGYGTSLKKAVKEGWYEIGLGAFGESLARWDNYIEIDKDLKDAWGIPALRISMTHGDNEAALMQDAGASAAEMLEAAGAKEYPRASERRNARNGHPRAGHSTHGERSEEVRSQCIQPVARREKSFRDGWRELRVFRVPEPDTYYDGRSPSAHAIT